MTDKAVSTEDLCIDLPRNASLEAARLEAVIKTLIENKVETLKNAKRKSSSITSSPKSLFNKLRGNSTSTVSSKDKDDITSIHSQKRHEKSGHRKASPSSPRPKAGRSLQFSDEDGNENFGFLHRDQPPGARCYCRNNPNEIQIHVDDDFISLNIDDYENLDPEEVAAIRTVKRAQRKKRRRRKHHRKQMKMTAVAVQVNDFKDLDDDELSQRARMTIVLTAFLLLFMCLLLVGITLRMAPLIDDMVAPAMSTHQVPSLDFPEINLLIDDPKPLRSHSLDTLQHNPPPRPHRNSCQISGYEHARRKSSRRSSAASSRRRRASRPQKWMTPEQKARERKRKLTVYVVAGTFLFILFSCVLVVIVTLTHRPETGRNFRKENEELMNSFDDPNHLQNLTVPVALK
ncbi:hypothetical protein TcasGA2_TC011199 [Tribolium castaneum]|uniref:Uncharacterized protein n=1 Tax=Tribolium castaneum TaxID=7070 RepID=D6X3S9_TRICA|nr:hypothetical protein TcasGA2_TC011199 [Tribolium castaneum]